MNHAYKLIMLLCLTSHIQCMKHEYEQGYALLESTITDELKEKLLQKANIPAKRYITDSAPVTLDFNPHKPHEFMTESDKRVLTLWHQKQKSTESRPQGLVVMAPPSAVYDPHHPKQIARISPKRGKWIILCSIEKNCTQHHLQGHEELVTSLQFSPHVPHQLASSSRDTTIKLWNTETQECTATLAGHDHWVRCIAFNPHVSGHLASGSRDATIKLWNINNLETEQCIATLTGHKKDVTCLAFNPHNDHELVSGSMDHMIKIWDLNDKICIRNLMGHTGYVLSLSFNKFYNNQCASSGADGKVILWNTQSNEAVYLISKPAAVKCIAFDPHKAHRLTMGTAENIVQINNLAPMCVLLALFDDPAISTPEQLKKAVSKYKDLKNLKKLIK